MKIDEDNETSHRSRRPTILYVDIDFYEDIDEMVHAVKAKFIDDPEVFKKILEDAEMSLYPNCTKILSCLNC